MKALTQKTVAGRFTLTAAALACGFLISFADDSLAQTAEADEESATIEEIVVTARRKEEKLRNIPIAATVLDGRSLLDRGPPMSARALLSGIPGLRFNDTTSPTTSEISMRGSGTGRGTSADSGVGLYRNGVYIGGGLQYGRNFFRLDMFDLERAEVLRGTQGALYGRNAVGGAINMISNRPVFEREGRVDLDYDFTLEKTQLQLIANEALSDTFAIRFGVDYIKQNSGKYYNKSFDRYFDEQDGYGARLQFRLQNGALDANLLLERQDMNVEAIVASLNVPPTPPNFPLGYQDEKYAYYWSTPGDGDELKLDNAILSITYDFGWSVLSSTTSFRDRHGITVSDVDNFSPASREAQIALGNPMTTVDPGQLLTADDETKTFYQELHLSGGSNSVSWLAGAELIDLESDFLIRFARTPGFLGVPLPGVDTRQMLKYESVAVYGSMEFDITPDFSLRGELRYTDDKKDFSAYGTILGTDTIITPPSAINTTFDNTAYNVVATYNFAEDFMAYAKVGTGYRVGGFNSVVTVPNQPNPVPPSYDNEESTTYEIGTKANLSDNVYIAVAAYLTDTDGVLVNDNNGCSLANACGQNPTSFTTNGGTSDVKGIEIETFANFEVGQGTFAPQFSISWQEGDISSEIAVYNGLTVPQTPEWIASADLTYNQPILNASELSVILHYSAQWGGTQDVVSPVFDMDDRQLIDLNIGIRTGQWEVFGYLNNVFDEEYYVLKQPTLHRWSGDGRSGGVRVRFLW